MRYRLKFQICSLLMIFISLTYNSSEATTIIAVRTEDAIFIGADSKDSLTPIKKCKIEQAGDIFVAFAGKPVVSKEITIIPLRPVKKEIFNGHEIIKKIGTMKIPVARKVDVFEATLLRDLPPVLESMRQYNTDYFCSTYLRGDKIILAAIIAGIDNNIPVLYGREFWIKTDCESPVVIDVTPMNHANSIAQNWADAIFYGEQAKILKDRPANLAVDKIAAYINEWITWEIIDRPDIVGPPIDILRITTDGTKWIQHKAECKEIQ